MMPPAVVRRRWTVARAMPAGRPNGFGTLPDMPIDSPDWVRDAVFYQVFPDRFASSSRVAKPGPLEPWLAPPTNHGFKGGDLLGIVERLPYLADLGITALYLNPVFASASNHRYHTYDYFSVDPLLGGEAALRELLDAAHGRGMRVILDGVFNHTGRGFWAFHHVLENGAGSPYRDWFFFEAEALDGRRPFRPYPWIADPAGSPPESVGAPTDDPAGDESLVRFGYRAWWGLPALPKLNLANPHAREHVMAAVEHWLRFGIDGWRLDVPTEIREPGFWEEFRRRVRAVNAEAYIVGEIWHEAPDWLAGDRFDAVMNYPLAQAILGFAAQGSLDERVVRAHHEYGRTVVRRDGAAFAAELERLMRLYDRGVTDVQLNLLGSHDSPRFRTMAGRDPAAYALAVLLQATLPGAPCTYYGDEVGLEGEHDPDCRRAFPWDETAWDPEAVAWTRAAYAARHALPALRRGSFRIAAADQDAVAFVRGADGGGGPVLVVVNAGSGPVELDVAMAELAGATLVDQPLPGDPGTPVAVGTDGWAAVTVPARHGRVLMAPVS
jgi:neopullulanase